MTPTAIALVAGIAGAVVLILNNFKKLISGWKNPDAETEQKPLMKGVGSIKSKVKDLDVVKFFGGLREDVDKLGDVAILFYYRRQVLEKATSPTKEEELKAVDVLLNAAVAMEVVVVEEE